MAEHTETTLRLRKQTVSFIESVEQSWNGITGDQLPEAIDQLTVIYEVYFRGILAQSAGEQYPPRYPCWYGDAEKLILDHCRVELRDPFGQRCGHLGTALASKNPSASANLFTLSRCFEEFDDGGADRIPGVWRHLHGELECSLAQIDLTQERQFEPAKKKHTKPVKKRVVEFLANFGGEHGEEALFGLTREQIALEVECSPTAVSNAPAYRNLQDAKRLAKHPESEDRKRLSMEFARRMNKPREEDD